MAGEVGLSQARLLCREFPRVVQLRHLLPRCVLTRPQRPPQDLGRLGMVTPVLGNDRGACPGLTLFMSSPGSKYRSQETERGQ